MAVRKISYQAMDGKWYDLQVADLIDPLDNLPKTKELIKDIQDGKLVLVVGEDYKNHEAENAKLKNKIERLNKALAIATDYVRSTL
jgi:hypothetical protein